jgi:hypothetical protein
MCDLFDVDSQPAYAKKSGVPINRSLIPNYHAPAESRNLQSILASKKGEVKIDIRDHFVSKRYWPGSIVEGTVTINSLEQLQSGGISIKLVCDSGVETYHHSLSLETWHRLLDLDMPIQEHVMTDTQVLLPGRSYTVPFHFVLPEDLGSEACTHKIHSEATRTLHSQPPPSLSGWEREVSVPRGVWLQYGIIAQVLGTGTPSYTKLAAKRTFQFLPRARQQPAPQITTAGQTHQYTASEQVKRYIYSKARAVVTLSSDRPQVIVLPTSGTDLSTTSVHMDLHFDCLDAETILPQTCIVCADLRTETWSSSAPLQDWPHLIDQKDSSSSVRSVAKRVQIKLAWEPQSSKEAGITHRPIGGIYSSGLEIPIGFLSEEELVLPTFYSCLVARTYQLRVTVKIGSSTVKLNFPIQLAM